MTPQRRVLVVDDDLEMLNLLRLILQGGGYEVVEASDGRAALRAAYEHHPDAILLDIMMPDLDGFEVCNRLREMSDVPIVFVTAKSNLDDLVRGFSLGGDDYVVKPFQAAELLSRLEAVLRRTRSDAREHGQSWAAHPATFRLDEERRELTLGERTVRLTARELAVVRLLISQPGRVFDADEIVAAAWGGRRPASANLVKQYVSRLRRKIELDPAVPRLLRNVRGGGYYFDPRGLS